MFRFFQKGVSLLLALIILAIILAMVLGLSTILVSQIRIIRGMGYSVIAFYAADSGIEKTLYEIFENSTTTSYFTDTLDNTASYETKIYCCSREILDVECEYDDFEFGGAVNPSPANPCNLNPHPPGVPGVDPPPIDPDCQATKYCVRSVGEYKDTKRAIEVKITPVSPAP